jgi:hypothetical protein
VAQAGAEVEDPHPRRKSRSLKEQARGTLDHGGLVIEPIQFLRLVAENVRLLRSGVTLHHPSSSRARTASGLLYATRLRVRGLKGSPRQYHSLQELQKRF